MGDKNESSPSKVDDNGRPCTSTKSLRISVMHHHAELTAGTSGATVTPTFNLNKSGNVEEDSWGTPRSTRRGRSTINSKTAEHTNTKIPTSDNGGKHGSPSDPATYLNSVRSNWNCDFLMSPINERIGSGTSNHNNSGNTSGYRLPQRKKNRLQESGGHHKTAEVFRKDLISAMKIPDTSHLSSEEYWVMRDTWRMEWEKGVQVPVNLGALPAAKIEIVLKDAKGDFRMPRKLIKTMPDAGDRDTVNLNLLADKTCRYDLDEVDVAWLKVINEERRWQGYEPLDEFTMEIIMEELESQCHESMQLAIKTKVGLGIEYDENIVCDVCKTPDSEDGNEMVFCDGCNLCVHQACYGILKVPAGSWLCKPCALGIRGSAVCILCGKKGGAMKSTKSGRKWAHMSCALWIPEVNIADPARMEPITKISHIPASRWSLLCTVCKERSIGACIQCAVKHCVTAYHVTCAMENGFEMLTDCCSPTTTTNAGESSVIFRSYCQKHSKNLKKKLENSPGKKSEEEKRSDRQKRIAELEEQFFTLVRGEAVSASLNIPLEMATQVMEYWKLKRKANFNRVLVTPKQEEGKALEEAAETGLQRRLKMFTHLRQDLERVRNLCYMIGKREKLKRVVVSQMRGIFLEQSHYFESLMVRNKGFNPKTFLSSLTSFGSEELVKKAKEESKELAKSDEWSHETSGDEVAELPVPDDIEDTGETIRLSRAQINVQESSPEKPSILVPESKRKNGLIKNHKRAKSLAKFEKSERLKSEMKSHGAKKHKPRAPSLSPNPEAGGQKKRENSPTSPETVHSSSSKHKPPRLKHVTDKENTPKVDTVKGGRSSRKSGLKRPNTDHSERSSQDDSSCDADTQPAAHKEKGTSAQAMKRLRVASDAKLSNKRDKTSSAKREGKEQREKPRRSPRHTDSSDLEDFEVSKHVLQKRKMTISTETISETERIDKKKLRSAETRAAGKNFDSSSTAGAKKTKTKGDIDHSERERSNDKKVKAAKLQSNSKGAENKVLLPSSRSTRSGSRNSESEVPTSRCLRSHSSSDESSRSAINETISNATKNEERALVPSSEIIVNTGVEHDKKEDIDPKKKFQKSSSPVQELEDQNRLESDDSSEFSSQKTLPSSALVKKTPIIAPEKPNMAYVAAGLNISYGSNAPLPLRQSAHYKSPPKTKSTGLRWLSISEDSNISQVENVSLQKNQNHGDVDESPLHDRCGGQKQTLTRKQPSMNPGKYRTGIGVYAPKSSDSSDDDFDISIPSSSEKSLSRQKLRSISNDIRYDSSDHQSITQSIVKQIDSGESARKHSVAKSNEPKNVRAVGGILDAQKSELSANALPQQVRTTGGDHSQDNFFEKFSLMTEKQPSSNQPQPFGSIGQTSNLPFGPVSAKMLDFQQSALSFQSHSLFPFGTPINPWQVGSNAMPSIIPSQYQPYNPYPARRIQEHRDHLNEHPSPPQLPDSTLSPESSAQNSASVAVLASSGCSRTPVTSTSNQREIHIQREITQSLYEDNEWEIVHDDDSTHVEHRRHHKHKKRKKKKKKRKRMLFPKDYDSEKREMSSPASPIHGAIVPKGHSTQFGVSKHSSQESENTESGSEKPQKLVLKINKKDLFTPQHHSAESHDERESGLKLTIKKSKYEHLKKKCKLHKHNHNLKQEVCDLARAKSPHNNVKLSVEKKSGLLKRLGITGDDLHSVDDDGIGRRALRERKPIVTKEKDAESTREKPAKRHNRNIQIVTDKSCRVGAESRANFKGEMRRENEQNANATMIASGIIPKRGRGRHKKDVHAVKRFAVKQERQYEKYREHSATDDRKDLAKFAGWTTTSSNNSNDKEPLSRSSSITSMSSHFKPSSVGLRGRGSTIPIRSFSTDSDQNFTLPGINSQDNQPARHWKKRKVHEHENQTSEQPDHVLPHNEKLSGSSSNPFASELNLNSFDGFNGTKKLPKTRSLDMFSEKSSPSHAKGHKLNQIITSLGEKASIRAVESEKTPPKGLDSSTYLGKRPTPHTPSKGRDLFNDYTGERQPPAKLTGNESLGMPALVKQRTKSEVSNTMSGKPYQLNHNMNFALQTAPLNYKIPKKLLQTMNEVVPDS